MGIKMGRGREGPEGGGRSALQIMYHGATVESWQLNEGTESMKMMDGSPVSGCSQDARCPLEPSNWEAIGGLGKDNFRYVG